MGSHVVQKTGNVTAVQRQLGHKNTVYAMQYMRVISEDELDEVVNDRSRALTALATAIIERGHRHLDRAKQSAMALTTTPNATNPERLGAPRSCSSRTATPP